MEHIHGKSSNVFSNLSSGTTYYVKTRVNDIAGNGLTESAATTAITQSLGTCSISVTDDGKWTISKTATITKTGNGTLQYRIVSGTTEKVGWTNYSSATTINWAANATTPTDIYCRVTDGTNIKDGATKSITKVDTTAPTLTLGKINTTTRSITVPYEASDNESGIKATKCEYGTSTSYGTVGTISNNRCVMNNVKAGEKYYYKIVTTNNAGMQAVKIGDSISGSFNGITMSPSPSGWSTSKTVTISGKTAGAVLEYSYDRKTWTNYTNALTITSMATSENPITVYARFNDGYNTSAEATLNITTNDPTAPTLTLGGAVSTTRKITIPFTATDNESGIKSTTCKYRKEEANEYTNATISGNTCVIDNLHDADETYIRRITTTNNAGASTTEVTVADILDIDSIKLSITEAAATCSKTKALKISAASIPSGTNLQYSIGNNGTWTNISNGDTITVTSNTTVYAILYDGINQSSEESFTITTIDTTAPTTIAPSATSTTNSITVTNNQTDNCGLNTGTLQYGISTSVNGTYTWQK